MQASIMRSSVASRQMHAAQPVRRAFTVAVDAKAATAKARTQERHRRIRRKLSGTPERPRLAVYRSHEHIYAQVIDDVAGHTLAAASTLCKDLKASIESSSTVSAAEAVGKKIAELCAAKNITKVAFDRGGNVYTGRVQAVAEGARAGGLQF